MSKIEITKDNAFTTIQDLVVEKVNFAIDDIVKQCGLDDTFLENDHTVSDKLDMEFRGVYELLANCIYKELVENNNNKEREVK